MPTNSKILILSQDYELFFQRSGTIEKCLFEPCDALLSFAQKRGIRITFFVDIGMILCMERFAASDRRLRRELKDITKHVATLVEQGHEIALHIHPHWEDTRWIGGNWDFSGSRYQLQFFNSAEVRNIVSSYATRLAEISGTAPRSYRAGGFCVEPFDLLRDGLKEAGISIDSSVVPGARLQDPDKGFDFASAPDIGWWRFENSPSVPISTGDFIEIPITPQKLSDFFYWGRLVERLLGSKTSGRFGDGTSKAIGRREIVRRLAGCSRVAELSVDDAKAQHLLTRRNLEAERVVWHLMGHPKLVSIQALQILDQFMDAKSIGRSETISSVAKMIASKELQSLS